MRILLSIALLAICMNSRAQNKIENVLIITTDGFRWQEVFKGMDTALANNNSYNEGSGKDIYRKYWAESESERRIKLLPFFWSFIKDNGQIYGNRDLGNNVNVSNPYWFSYPGYSEIFCGYVDTLVNSNSYKANPNTNLLEFLNKQNGFRKRVMAFGAWDAFDRILNEQRSGFPVYSAFDSVGGSHPNAKEILINDMMRDCYKIMGLGEVPDVYTHYSAMEAFRKNKPHAMYIAYGETDEFAHEGKYNSYLDAAHQFDTWLKSLWEFLQSRPRYKNKTAIFITTDHGRGDKIKSEWTDHGSNTAGSDEIWFAVMAPGIAHKGEVHQKMQVYQKQFAQTIAAMLGFTFTSEHPVAEKVEAVFEN